MLMKVRNGLAVSAVHLLAVFTAQHTRFTARPHTYPRAAIHGQYWWGPNFKIPFIGEAHNDLLVRPSQLRASRVKYWWGPGLLGYNGSPRMQLGHFFKFEPSVICKKCIKNYYTQLLSLDVSQDCCLGMAVRLTMATSRFLSLTHIRPWPTF